MNLLMIGKKLEEYKLLNFDLKPSNIVVMTNKLVKLIDFGLGDDFSLEFLMTMSEMVSTTF